MLTTDNYLYMYVSHSVVTWYRFIEMLIAHTLFLNHRRYPIILNITPIAEEGLADILLMLLVNFNDLSSGF